MQHLLGIGQVLGATHGPLGRLMPVHPAVAGTKVATRQVLQPLADMLRQLTGVQ